jgi:hypothetical protein
MGDDSGEPSRWSYKQPMFGIQKLSSVSFCDWFALKKEQQRQIENVYSFPKF